MGPKRADFVEMFERLLVDDNDDIEADFINGILNVTSATMNSRAEDEFSALLSVAADARRKASPRCCALMVDRAHKMFDEFWNRYAVVRESSNMKLTQKQLRRIIKETLVEVSKKKSESSGKKAAHDLADELGLGTGREEVG